MSIYKGMTRIYLCWFPQFPLDQIRPELTLVSLLEQANRGDESALARLVKVNWIVQDLGTNRIRKPLVLDHARRTIVGDNRLMALSLRSEQITVPVLIQSQQPLGQVIQDLEQIPVLTELTDHPQISWSPAWCDPLQEPVHWFDIGDRSTVHHPMDRAWCTTVMTRYLEANPGVKFDADWCRSPIDWNQYC